MQQLILIELYKRGSNISGHEIITTLNTTIDNNVGITLNEEWQEKMIRQ